MNIMDMLNFNFAEVTIIDIALISISPIAILATIVRYRSQIFQFILRRFQTIQIFGKNMMTALRAGWHHEIIQKTQPANINQEETRAAPPEPNLQTIRNALIEYIKRESRILKRDDFGKENYIGYFCGYGPHKIWLTIWIGDSLDIIATRLMISKEYHNTFERLQENWDKIEWLFPEEKVDHRSLPNDIQGIGVEKRVDLTQRGNWQTTSVWVRENLEKLLYVIRIHDAIQESEDDLPF